MTVAFVPATGRSLPFVRRAHQNNPLHPNLAIPYESHLYNGSYPAIRRYADFSHPRTRALLVAEILRTEHIRRWTPAPSLTETLESITRYDSTASVDGLLGRGPRVKGSRAGGRKRRNIRSVDGPFCLALSERRSFTSSATAGMWRYPTRRPSLDPSMYMLWLTVAAVPCRGRRGPSFHGRQGLSAGAL